jgi:phosphoglycolate phosphatase
VLRALLFAFHDVLVDDAPVHRECLRRALAEEGIDLPGEAYERHYQGGDPRPALAALLAAAGKTVSPILKIRLETRQASYFHDRVRTEGLPFGPGVLDLIPRLVAADWTLGVVSRAEREEIERELQRAGVRASFKVVVAGDEVVAPKPDPAGHLAALEALNALPPLPERLFHGHEVLAAEASPEGIAAAKAAGCSTLGLGHGKRGRQLGADWTIESFEGLTPARLHQRLAEASRR